MEQNRQKEKSARKGTRNRHTQEFQKTLNWTGPTVSVLSLILQLQSHACHEREPTHENPWSARIQRLDSSETTDGKLFLVWYMLRLVPNSRGFPQQLMGTEAETHSQTLGKAQGILGNREIGARGVKDTSSKPTKTNRPGLMGALRDCTANQRACM